MKCKNKFNIVLLFILLLALLAACGPDAPTSDTAFEPFTIQEEGGETDAAAVVDNADAVGTTAVEPAAVEPTAKPTKEPTAVSDQEEKVDEPEPAAEQAAEPVTPPAAPTPVTVILEDAAGRFGDADAPITVVEYTDYQCPFCERHVTETMPQIMAEFVDTGLVQYIIKDYPLDSLHPEARIAAAAARCAADQEAYGLMHDAIFEQQSLWSGIGSERATGVIVGIASSLGMDTAVFSECIESGKHDAVIQQNLEEGMALGVTGTPAFFIDGYPVTGAQPIELFRYAFELAEKGELAAAYVPQEQPTQEAPPPPSEPVDIPIGSSYAVGDPDAPVVIIEYTDFQCPFCVRHQQQTFPQIYDNFIESGDVYYVYKDFPLSSIHPQAVKASEAARCAGDQKAYREMHDQLFDTQQEWSGQSDVIAIFTTYAGELGLDTAVFNQCLTDGEHEIEVLSNVEEGLENGVGGTPAFFINGHFISGAQPYTVFEQAILSLLDE